MWQIAFPVIFAVLVWWIGTGAILYLVRLSPRTYGASIAVASVPLVAALSMLAAIQGQTAADAYVAFTAAIVVWGFVELTFLTGWITGPRKTACPPGSRGWLRARHATEAIIYHELALAAAGVAIVAVTWSTGNPVGAATFAVLWVMRLSSKLNLFLGVRFLNADLLPQQLQHLRSYFRRRSMNPLLPVSLIGASATAWWLASGAFAAGASDFESTASILLAALLALAVIEHLFMVIPIPVARLWGRVAETKFSGGKPHPVNPT